MADLAKTLNTKIISHYSYDAFYKSIKKQFQSTEINENLQSLSYLMIIVNYMALTMNVFVLSCASSFFQYAATFLYKVLQPNSEN